MNNFKTTKNAQTEASTANNYTIKPSSAAIVSGETIDDMLENVTNINHLLTVIFADYEIQYYQDPLPGRKKFLEKAMDKIHELNR